MSAQRVFVSWCWATRFIGQEVRIDSLRSNFSALMGALDCARQVHAHDAAKLVQNLLVAEAHSVLRWCLNAWREHAKAVMAMEQVKLLQDSGSSRIGHTVHMASRLLLRMAAGHGSAHGHGRVMYFTVFSAWRSVLWHPTGRVRRLQNSKWRERHSRTIFGLVETWRGGTALGLIHLCFSQWSREKLIARMMGDSRSWSREVRVRCIGPAGVIAVKHCSAAAWAMVSRTFLWWCLIVSDESRARFKGDLHMMVELLQQATATCKELRTSLLALKQESARSAVFMCRAVFNSWQGFTQTAANEMLEG